jgi:hypothetical protein
MFQDLPPLKFEGRYGLTALLEVMPVKKE